MFQDVLKSKLKVFQMLKSTLLKLRKGLNQDVNNKIKIEERSRPIMRLHELELSQDFSEMETELIENLIHARKKLGITQEGLAEMTGLSQAAIGRLESMKTNPTLKTLFKILQALDLKLVFVEKE